jgi:hypothetical protein
MEFQRVVPVIAPAQSVPGRLGSDDNATLLGSLGEIAGTNAVVLGHNVEIMCELIRRGCRAVTELQQNDRPEQGSADLVIVSSVGAVDGAVTAIAHARRGLRRSGRIVVRTAANPARWLGHAIERTLRVHGFSAIRVCRIMDCTMFTAELPLFAPVARLKAA